MEPQPQSLTMYGAPARGAPLDWPAVRDRLAAAPFYWVDAPTGDGGPHPRPVWGVWHDDALCLTLGSPTLRRRLRPGGPATVHTGDAMHPVIVDGAVHDETRAETVVSAYNAKYEWQYDVEAYGPLIVVAPRTVLAWDAAGEAGRDGFVTAGKWTFPTED